GSKKKTIHDVAKPVLDIDKKHMTCVAKDFYSVGTVVVERLQAAIKEVGGTRGAVD
ncbi:unnamed protein product, partial [Prorocentrum cordatum]